MMADLAFLFHSHKHCDVLTHSWLGLLACFSSMLIALHSECHFTSPLRINTLEYQLLLVLTLEIRTFVYFFDAKNNS